MPLEQSQRDDWAVEMCKAVRGLVGGMMESIKLVGLSGDGAA